MNQRLKANYVVAVGEHQLLTRGPTSEWWANLVKATRPGYAGGSTQGYYVLAADGTGFLADNYPPRLPAFLDRGLELFRRLPRKDAGVTEADIRRDAPMPPPAGASVLRLYTRTRGDDGAMIAGTWLARDSVWVLSEEVRAIASSTSGPLPRTLTARLVLFHMVDGTRGQVWPWQPQSVRRAELTARLTRSAGAVRTYALSGSFAKRDSHPPQWSDRGQEGTVEGEFDIDTSAMTVTRFRALAQSEAWSDATYSPVAPPPRGRYRLSTAIVEATDELARQVPPEPSFIGPGYLRPMLPGR